MEHLNLTRDEGVWELRSSAVVTWHLYLLRADLFWYHKALDVSRIKASGSFLKELVSLYLKCM